MSVSPRRILLVLFMGVLMAALDIALVGPAIPALQEAFGIGKRSVAWVFNVFVLFNIVSIPLTTRLADLAGRRVVYAIAVGVFGAGSLIVALSPSFTVLLVGRAVQGMAASGIFPAASAVVGDAFPVERRGRALGILGAVYGIAFVVGPIIAGIVLGVAGWSWLFLLNVPLALVVGVVGWRVLPPSQATATGQLDVRGMLALGLMLAAAAYGINQIDATSFVQSMRSVQVWPFIVGAAVILPLFIRIERRASDPLIRLDLFRSRQVQRAGALAAGAGLAEAAFIFFPDLAVAAFGVTKSAASFMLLPLVGAVAVGSPVAGRLLDRVGSRMIVAVGCALLTLGFALIGWMPAVKAAFYGGSVCIGLGLAGLLGSSLSYILLHEARAAERTVAQGIITLFLGIGQLAGGAFIGAIAESSGTGVAGYAQALLTLAAITGGLTALALGLKGRAAEQASVASPQADSLG